MDNDIFSGLFPNFNAGLDASDIPKAKALLAVVCKSSASLSDVYTLAESLDLSIEIRAKSKPKETAEAPERDRN